MFVLIPLGGKGQRFKVKGFSEPKGLIKVLEKPIIYYLLENLNFTGVEFFYIPYHREYQLYDFEKKIIRDFPNHNFKFLPLERDTEGAAETIKIALEKLKIVDSPILCLDADNFYQEDIIKIWGGKNKIITFRDDNIENLYSYIHIEENLVKTIREKEKISNLACTGAYGFESYKILLKNITYIISNKNKNKNEYYTSGVIDLMLSKNIKFENYTIKNKNFYSLGTPELVENFKKAFLFDLDGTLVSTDRIYFSVWKNILQKYNLDIDYDFFINFIRGKSDKDFLNFLYPGLSNTEYLNISKMKDDLFVKKIQKNNIIFPDVIDFFQKIKNGKIAIVTSSNKKSANQIIKKYGLDEYINLLISSEDCKKHKPSPEPYEKAINIFSERKNNIFIFEDSLSGLKSALSSGVRNVFLRNSNIDIKYENKFENLMEIELGNSISKSIPTTVKIIKDTINDTTIKKILDNKNNFKTGYICDIKSYKISHLDDSEQNIVYKISNFENQLSLTAEQLKLYDNEIFFYEEISSFVNINIPKFFGVTVEKGIILEDLHSYEGFFNMNLNNKIKNILRIVDDIHMLHKKFFFKSESLLNQNMKYLKKPNEIIFYKKLLDERKSLFFEKNTFLLNDQDLELFQILFKDFETNCDYLSKFPLSLCHGDLKSPNIFYKDAKTPYYLDWQYLHLNKGVSDIVFLLVESLNFDEMTLEIVIKYYFKLSGRDDYDIYLKEIKSSLSVFPFFVTVWFNTEKTESLLDKSFPVIFMKNYLKYLRYYY